MTYESNLMLESKVVIHGSTNQTAALGHIKSALRQVFHGEDEPSVRIESWHAIYKYMMEQDVHLSAETWLEILEDEDIGPVVENRDERYQALLKSMPHNNGYPMRINQQTFQPMLYVDGEWVGIEVIADPDPSLVEQQEAAEDFHQTVAETEQFLAESDARMAEAHEFMDRIETDLNYDDAMSVVDDSK